MKISDHIPYGRANAVSMRELSAQLHVDMRTVRAIVQREREKGAPICTNYEGGGYFLPIDESEALTYYRQQRRRIRSASAALNGVRKYLKGGERL